MVAVTIAEARAKAVSHIEALITVAKGGARLRQAHVDNAYAALDAYALEAHVQACVKGHVGDLSTSPEHYQGCGDGWFCDKAREIERTPR